MKSLSALSSKLLTSALLLTAIGLITFSALRPQPEPALSQPLATLLPSSVSGWITKDLPIAETEEMKKAVGEMLNYDDAAYRTYAQGTVTVSVYVAYWKPGKMSPRLIASHTPDICWVANGWKCTARDFAYQLPAMSAEGTTAGSYLPKPVQTQVDLSRSKLKPAQAGTYEVAGNVQHVLFWHLHHGQLVVYNTGKQPPWYAPVSDLWQSGFNQRGEQFFIRIASNVPMSEAIKTDAVRNALQSLGPLGLYSNR